MTRAVLSNVLRRRGERTNCEERQFELRGSEVILHQWIATGGFGRTKLRASPTVHRDRSTAMKAMRAAVRALIAEGWGELPSWPELPSDWGLPPSPARPPKGPKPPPSRRRRVLSRMRLSQVKVLGRAKPVGRRRLEAFEAAVGRGPPSWLVWLARFGAGTFAGRLRFATPERALRDTRRFQRTYRDEDPTFFTNSAVLGGRARELVLIASSIEGDRLGYLPNAPDRLFVLPRNGSEIEVMSHLGQVLTRYATLAARVDGTSATFSAER